MCLFTNWKDLLQLTLTLRAGISFWQKKCQQDHSSDTRARVSATALYYNNPLWLQWLLEQDLNTKTIRGDGASSHTLTTETPTNDVDDEDLVHFPRRYRFL